VPAVVQAHSHLLGLLPLEDPTCKRVWFPIAPTTPLDLTAPSRAMSPVPMVWILGVAWALLGGGGALGGGPVEPHYPLSVLPDLRCEHWP
jgi:hypothetical protein